MSKQMVNNSIFLKGKKSKGQSKGQSNWKISSNFSGLDLTIATFLAKQVIVGRAGRYKAALVWCLSAIKRDQ
jgi:hypothetical protein